MGEVVREHHLRNVLISEVVEVVQRLALGLVERLSRALVFSHEDARPVQVKTARTSGTGSARVLLEEPHTSSINAEDLKELIPKGLSLSLF